MSDPASTDFPPESTPASVPTEALTPQEALTLPAGVSVTPVHTPETLKPLNNLAVQAAKAEQGLANDLELAMTEAEKAASQLADKMSAEVKLDITALHLHGHIAINSIVVKNSAVGIVNTASRLNGAPPSPRGTWDITVSGSDRNGAFTKRKVLQSQPGLLHLLAELATIHLW